MASEDELKEWMAGEDVDRIRKGRGRTGVSAQLWAVQAFVVAFGAIYLAWVATPWWLVILVPAGWMTRRAIVVSRKRATWERLYGRDDDNERLA